MRGLAKFVVIIFVKESGFTLAVDIVANNWALKGLRVFCATLLTLYIALLAVLMLTFDGLHHKQ